MLNEKDYSGPNVFFPVRKILRENREQAQMIKDLYAQVGRAQETIDTITKDTGRRFRNAGRDARLLEAAKIIIRELGDA